VSLTQARSHAVCRSVQMLMVKISLTNDLYSEQQHVGNVKPVFVIKTGRPGRPRKVPELTYLEEAMSPRRRITLTHLAKVLGIHRHTLWYYLKLNNVDYSFSVLSNADLDTLVKSFRSARPDLGLRTLIGFLRSHHLRIQKRRVVGAIHRVDGIGSVLQHQTTIRHRKYKVACPNALWHMDGHHKLILWGIVIHGFIDGYSRLVCQLICSSELVRLMHLT
jgi:hypothetical protein